MNTTQPTRDMAAADDAAARQRAAAAPAADRDRATAADDAPAERKLTEAEIAAIEEDNLRRKYMYPQKDATSSPPVSANDPPRQTIEEYLADMKYPASKGDLTLRARNNGSLDERYAMERLEDRMFMDFEDVQRALRA